MRIGSRRPRWLSGADTAASAGPPDVPAAGPGTGTSAEKAAPAESSADQRSFVRSGLDDAAAVGSGAEDGATAERPAADIGVAGPPAGVDDGVRAAVEAPAADAGGVAAEGRAGATVGVETGTGPDPGRASVLGRGGWPARAALVLVPLVIYTGLAMLRIAPAWRAPTRLTQCGCGDGGFTMWYLGWIPYALSHGHNPFFTDWLFFPTGANVMWNASVPLPALLLAPLTAGWGVIFSYNVLVVVAFAGTALSAYLVLRRWAPWPPGAFAGGLLYGFSPYMIGQGLGHAHMLLLLMIPVLLLLLDDVLVRQRMRAWISGPLLGVTAVAQLLTAEELLASALLVAAVGVLLLMILFPGRIWSRLPHAAAGLALAAVTALVLAAVPLWNQLTGPQRLNGTVSSPDRYRADLLSWVVPSQLVHFAPPSALQLSAKFPGNTAENGSYLGIPLLVVALAVTVLLWRRRPVVRWAGLMMLAVLVLASGPSLRIGGEETGVPLPFQVVEHLPLLKSLVSVRLASYAVLLCALLLAVGMDGLCARIRAGRREPPGNLSAAGIEPAVGGEPTAGGSTAGAHRTQPLLAAGLAAVVAVVALLPLLPASYSYSGIRDADVPPWFTSAALERVPAGSVLVTLPPASPATSAPMVWQAVADYRFKAPFGYTLHPGPGGRGQFGPFPSTFTGIMAQIRRGPMPRVTAAGIRDMRVDLHGWQVRTIVLPDEAHGHTAQQVDVLTRVLGRAPEHDSGSWVWYDIDPAGLAGLATVPPPWPPEPVRLPSG